MGAMTEPQSSPTLPATPRTTGRLVRNTGLESLVTVFPRDPRHRLVGPDLALFLDRVVERLVAVGEGALTRVRAGRFDCEAESLPDLLDTIEAAREQARGREDLEVRLHGEARPDFSKFLGATRVEMKFCAFVEPKLLLDAHPCAACGWPLDYDGVSRVSTCGQCGESEPRPDELHTCWWLRLFGTGADGIGERFVVESRRLTGSPFFESLEAAARTRLYEWHCWG